MIEAISIAGTATFGALPETLDGLSQFNFIYGANGTGKTTISRVIADERAFPTCKVTWKRGTPLQPMVYNRDFVDRNFNPSTDLKGVFTLGEKQADSLTKIETAKDELDALTKKVETLTNSLQGADGTGGKKGELAALESEFKDKCWAQKQKHDPKLQGAFEGFRGSAEKFKGKLVLELSNNSETLSTLEELEKRAATVFGTTPTTEQLIPGLDATKSIAHETNPILGKRVIGKDDVDIAAMIRKLANSDWVREGRAFYDLNQGVCPFCQQNTTDLFAKSLNEYFDETFENESKAIDDLVTNYKTDSARLQQQVASILAAPSRFLDAEKLKTEKELLDSIFTINYQRISQKKKEPSQVIELESISNVVAALKTIIDSTNALIGEHNRMVANLSQERTKLTAQVWKFLLDHELKDYLVTYKQTKEALDKAIAGMSSQIVTARSESTKKEAEIRELEKQTTSVQPTIDEINALLSSFGFKGFSLAKAASGTSYKLIRSDGTDAKATLSEGEKTFVTFLYFYHLLKGSDSESGMTMDRVVVFDDPVSSLDSDILFIVGSLIKGLFEEVRTGVGHLKQVFVLTHNVYFHKEVTFNPRRDKAVCLCEETFWVVRKPGDISKFDNHPSNPIKTSYELLWAEVRKADRTNLTIQNTLRRILENYFKILGRVDLNKICEMFEGKEKLLCNSLVSWVHDGSHFAHDDLYVSIDEAMVEAYLKVFEAIFYKMKHEGHYQMMMGNPGG
ncbi:ATP-binding protein [Geothrix fuzhouensis]|uniref:ATP-binding protein n=1 Tax=Geothrix fuzhouensis TaxID=2966451 RepID=UPI002147D922|nr:AAA family ATPase [Geothrix fuzhouensis]